MWARSNKTAKEPTYSNLTAKTHVYTIKEVKRCIYCDAIISQKILEQHTAPILPLRQFMVSTMEITTLSIGFARDANIVLNRKSSCALAETFMLIRISNLC